MKAEFVGDPTQPGEVVPDELTHLGVTFKKGKASDIPKELEEKFVGNNHFKVSDGKAKAAETSGTTPSETVAALTERVSTVDDVEALKAELATETRTTGKAAIEARIAELEAE